MRISTDYKFIFFSNPKTGSESVRKLLNPYSDVMDKRSDEKSPFTSHMPPKQVKSLFKEKGWDYDSFYKFVFVRNPWDKMVSLYEMKYSGKPTKVLVSGTMEHKIKDRLKKFKQRYFDKKPSFKEWIHSIEQISEHEKNNIKSEWFKYGIDPLNKYICDDEGNILVDQVIRLEDIDRELIPTLTKLKIPNAESLVIEEINKRKHKKYTEYYDSDSISIVEKLFQYDIKEYKYEFGS